MQAATRLSAQALGELAPGVRRPDYDWARTRVGHVHLGVGAFMRAFVAVYNDDAMAAQPGDWGIAGVSLRSPRVRDQLRPQDCLYTLNVRDNSSDSHRLVASIRSIDVAPDDPQNIIDRISAAAVQVVTLTVTEKGYCIAPDSGELDRGNPALLNDLADPRNPQSTPGFLVAGLQQRRQANGGPLTIVSCDNLPENGSRLREGVLAFADEVDVSLRAWIEANVSFPATMVDRITPATTNADIDAAAKLIGLRDEAMVKTEPFVQWVIEDNFAAERPYWEAGGAMLVDDVRPYELAKLRLLNGPHSALAYLGYLGGHELISDVMRSADFAAYAALLMRHEISPVTAEPAGMKHADYIDVLLLRFANAALQHRTWQIAMDGSQKIPQRLLNTVRSQLQRGGPIAGLALAVAAWMRYALGRDEQGGAIDVQDPMRDSFAQIAALKDADADDIVTRFVNLRSVFGTDLSENRRFVSTLAGQFRLLIEKGAAGAVRDYVMNSGGE